MVNKATGVPLGGGAEGEFRQIGEKMRTAREQVSDANLGPAGDAMNAVQDSRAGVKLFADALLSGPPNDYLLAMGTNADGQTQKPDAPASIDASKA